MQDQSPKTSSQIISLCIGFLGIQIGFALQAGNVTRILQNFGADLTQVSLLWLIAPLSGALVQLLIGLWSDRNINLGHTRVPYILFGGVLSALALYALPNADLLIALLSPLLVGALIIILIDISFNISMHPLRATIADYLPIHQQPKGYAIQTFLISLGAIIGSTLPYILHQFFHFETISSEGHIPENVKWSFYIGAIVLLICLILTSKAILNGTNKSEQPKKIEQSKSFKIPHMSQKMWQLGLIQFFSWAAFFLIWIFMIPALAQHIYGEYNFSAQSKHYAEAANNTGILFGLYHLSASIFALLLTRLYDRLGIILTHSIALMIGAIGILTIYLSTNMYQLVLPMLCIGIAWASILATPYCLLSRIISRENVGLYFGIFNLFITIPQIVMGLCSGLIIETYFNGKAIFAILIAGVFLGIAALCSLFFRKSLRLR